MTLYYPAQPGSTAQRLRSFISSRPSSRITFQLSLILLSAAATRGPVWETFQTGLARSPGTALIGRYRPVSAVSLSAECGAYLVSGEVDPDCLTRAVYRLLQLREPQSACLNTTRSQES